MSETYARGGQRPTTAGGLILLLSSSLAAVLVVAGLMYARGSTARHNAEVIANAKLVTSQFMKIWLPARQKLKADQVAYNRNQRRNLAAAESALMAEATSERAFGTDLAEIVFPDAVATAAAALVTDNQARANLTAEQARSSSVTQLRSFNGRVDAATAAVQKEIKFIRMTLASEAQAG
jgi:hypothetical protein